MKTLQAKKTTGVTLKPSAKKTPTGAKTPQGGGQTYEFIEAGDFNGFPVMKFYKKKGGGDDRSNMKMLGLAKVKLVINNLEEAKAFVASNGTSVQ